MLALPEPPPGSARGMSRPPTNQRRVTAAELPGQQATLRGGSGPSDAMATASMVEAEMAASSTAAANRLPTMLPVIPAPPSSTPPNGAMDLMGPPGSSCSSRGSAAMGRVRLKSNAAMSFARGAGAPAGAPMPATPSQLMERMNAATPGYQSDRTVRTETGSEMQVPAEDQFRLSLHQQQQQNGGGLNAAGLPLPKFETSMEKSMPPLQTELPAGQRSALEAAVLERTKQLNRLFEDQVKKQYDAMRREVSKLAKAHQRDVAALDARFKAKMAGLASRFKQLEEEEAQVAIVKQENDELQVEIAKLVEIMEEQDRRNEASLATIAERDGTIAALNDQLQRLHEQQAELEMEMARRQAEAAATQAALEATVAKHEATIAKKKEDLKTMQQRLVTAKSAYDTEVIRKQAEVSELEGSMRQLNEYTKQMQGYTTQVQGQIMTREQDMKVQLGLMKNTIAFALYIDETLQVDLTDPHSCSLLTRPVTVFPSGVTYSADTVDKIHAQAAKNKEEPKCPQTGEVITHTAPNPVIESILSRFLFKQQLTKDVMHALREYQTKTPMGEEDQPLEMYLQRMKASMVERLEGLHSEAMAKSQYSYQQQLDVKTMELDKKESAYAAMQKELEELRNDANASKMQALADAAAAEDQMEELRTKTRAAEEEADALKVKRDELLHRVTRMGAKLTRLEEGAEDDADALDEPTSNKSIQRVRKADLLQLRAELDAKLELLEELRRTIEQKDAEILKLREELASMRRELAGEKRVTGTLSEERDKLAERVKALEREGAATLSDLERAKAQVAHTEGELRAAEEQGKKSHLKSGEATLKLEQTSKDAEKLRARLESKEELCKDLNDTAATLQAKMEELLAESGRKERALTVARGQALEGKQKCLEVEQSATWLAEDKKRLEELLAKRDAEIAALSERATTAESISKMLGARLDEMGAKDAEASLEMKPLGDIQKQAGVFDPLAQLPNVPVIGQLYESIDTTQGTIKALTSASGQLATMAQVDVLNIDQTLPADEGMLRSTEPVPLPYPPVLMRQFTPPPENLRPPSPPPPEESGVFAKPQASGAGALVQLGEEDAGAASKQLPEQS